MDERIDSFPPNKIFTFPFQPTTVGNDISLQQISIKDGRTVEVVVSYRAPVLYTFIRLLFEFVDIREPGTTPDVSVSARVNHKRERTSV